MFKKFDRSSKKKEFIGDKKLFETIGFQYPSNQDNNEEKVIRAFGVELHVKWNVTSSDEKVQESGKMAERGNS